jgi:flagellar hook-length control protein FliK
VTFAIEPTVKPTLEIPAPIISVPHAGDRTSISSPSFQDHLDRAGRSGGGANASGRSSSNPTGTDRNDIQARRNEDAGDRAEAERREEAAANENRPVDSTAPKADDSKSKPTQGETKVEAKKKPGEHKKKDENGQDGDATNVGTVAVVAAQEAAATDEVTLTTDEAGADADATATEIALPTDGNKKGQGTGSPLDPTLEKQTKAGEQGKNGVKVDGQIDPAAAALAEAQAKEDAAAKDGDESAEEAPLVPLVSELHSTKIAGTDVQRPKTRGEFTVETQAADAKSDAAGDVVIEATSTKTTAEPGAKVAEQVVAPEKEQSKKDGPSATNADPSFAAQLHGAVEAVAAATTATTTIGSADLTTTTDASGATPTTTTTTADATKPVTTRTSDATLTAAESLRSNSSKDTTSTRAAGDEGRQADGLSTADRARLVQRVARAVRTAQDRGGELQIRLSPPELGQLRLQIQMTDGTLSARIEAESPQAKQVITENLGQLRERLAEQNIRVDRIDVELMNTGNGGSPNLPDRRQDFSHDGPTPRGFGSTTRNGNSGDAAAVEATGPSAATPAPGRLNVVI